MRKLKYLVAIWPPNARWKTLGEWTFTDVSPSISKEFRTYRLAEKFAKENKPECNSCMERIQCLTGTECRRVHISYRSSKGVLPCTGIDNVR